MVPSGDLHKLDSTGIDSNSEFTFYPADLVELPLPEGFGLDTGTVSGSSDAFRYVSVVVHVVFDDFVDSARCQRDMTQLLIFCL